jgi:hypothetical protein
MRDQEPIMTKYFDLLMQRLHENCEKPVDMVNWYNLTTFDIISDLTFGESFHRLENSRLHVGSHGSDFTQRLIQCSFGSQPSSYSSNQPTYSA